MFTEKYRTALEGYEMFWERKSLGRPVLNMSFFDPKPGYEPYRPYRDLEEKWLDPEYTLGRFRHQVTHSGYLAEGVPMYFTNLGPGCLAACIGSGYQLAENTIWFDRNPVIRDWEDLPPIAFSEQSDMWQRIIRLQEKAALDPDVHFSITDIGGILDIVASLRGTENLLYDLYDYPDEVKAFSRKVTELWFRAFDRQVEMVRKNGQPFNNWMNIPSLKPWYPLQCDFCYMISPAQFEEFVLTDLAAQAAHMERSIYHLDGPGELVHADTILDIPGLTGIQWISGDGNEPLTDEKWFGLYRKIQDKKKNIVLLNVGEDELSRAEPLIKSIDPAGVYISTRCSSREKAEELLEKITRWSE